MNNTDFDSIYFATLRRLGPAGRLKIACELYDFARNFMTVNLRARHPDWSEAELKQAVSERLRASH